MLGRSVPYLLVRSENVNAFIRKDTVEINKKRKYYSNCSKPQDHTHYGMDSNLQIILLHITQDQLMLIF